MLIIAHRINTPEALRALPKTFGLEMDLHAYGDRLVVHHDPFVDAVDFETYLADYDHAFLVVNIKEEGIEARVFDILKRHHIQNFFLLDVSAPVLYQWAMKGEKRLCVRVSAYESVQTALTLRDKVEWAFIDTLEEKLSLTKDEYDALKAAGFRLCLVSHDVWKRDTALTRELKADAARRGILFDAVLTKIPKSGPFKI